MVAARLLGALLSLLTYFYDFDTWPLPAEIVYPADLPSGCTTTYSNARRIYNGSGNYLMATDATTHRGQFVIDWGSEVYVQNWSYYSYTTSGQIYTYVTLCAADGTQLLERQYTYGYPAGDTAALSGVRYMVFGIYESGGSSGAWSGIDDLSITMEGSTAISTAIPTATVTPTITPTVVSATSTPVPTFTPYPTFTPFPTATPFPTSTPSCTLGEPCFFILQTTPTPIPTVQAPETVSYSASGSPWVLGSEGIAWVNLQEYDMGCPILITGIFVGSAQVCITYVEIASIHLLDGSVPLWPFTGLLVMVVIVYVMKR